MNDVVKKVLRFLGFDRAVTFGILARCWSLISGPVTMVVIATGLSPIQQGFYFTFSSLLALQTFFDLGLMYVVAQFTSHEFVKLSWGKNGAVHGDPVALLRFRDLLSKTVLWFAIAALLMITLLVPAGLFFFGQKGDVDFAWQLPWVLAVIGTGLNLLVTPFFAIIMGSGDVVTANKRNLVGVILSSILCWLVLGLHGGLYAAFAVNLGALSISWGYLLTKRPELLKLAWSGLLDYGRSVGNSHGLSWWKEIWPMQWRMAVSTGAAYFIFQLFNPVLFHYHGSVVAGQMGMTLTAANALLMGSLTIVNAKTPEFGKLVALRDWDRLDQLFFRTIKHAFGLVMVGAIVGVGLIWFLQENFSIGQRFIPAGHAALLFGSVCFQTVSGSFANYLRAHKIEPLMKMTVIASILQGVATWYLGKSYASLGVTAGFFTISSLFVLPYVLTVWKRCRREWHTTEHGCQ